MGRITPYNPEHINKPLPTEADVQRMFTKLQTKLQAKVEVMPAESGLCPGTSVAVGVASTENTPLLEWDKPVRNPDGTGYCKTKDGRYSVCKVRLNGHMTYELWSILPEWKFQMAVGLESFEAAKERAEAHAKKDPARQKPEAA